MIRAIILLIVVILILSFFGISIPHVVESSAGQANFSYVGDLLKQGWNYLAAFINGMTSSIHHLI